MATRWFIGTTLVVMAIMAGIFMSLGSWKAYRMQREEADGVRLELQKLQDEQIRMTREKAKIDSPAHREEAARARGYLRPGEKRLELP